MYVVLFSVWSESKCNTFPLQQVSTCAATTMATAPSSVSPPPRPPGPACARRATAWRRDSSPARVRRIFTAAFTHTGGMSSEQTLSVLPLSRYGLVPALLRSRGNQRNSTGPSGQIWRLGASVWHLSGGWHRLPRWWATLRDNSDCTAAL